MAAVVARDDYNVAQDISLGHFTHEKSPLGSVAALAMLELIERDQLLKKVEEDALFMREQLHLLKSRYAVIGDVRGIGLLWGVELVKDRASKDRAAREADFVLYECLQNGLSFKVSQGNVIQLSPPLIIERPQLADAVQILENAIAKVVD